MLTMIVVSRSGIVATLEQHGQVIYMNDFEPIARSWKSACRMLASDGWKLAGWIQDI